MSTLASIFGDIPQVCFKDEKGVYLGTEKIALDNQRNSAYIRRNGEQSITKQPGCEFLYDLEIPLKFVCAVPGGDPLLVETAVLAALSNSSNNITASEIIKEVIAESEGIPLEELTKFVNVAIVMVEYTELTTQLLDPSYLYDLC